MIAGDFIQIVESPPKNWGKRSGYNCALLESFVGMRKNGIWNDFVAVFVKDEFYNGKHISRIQNASMQFMNGRLYNSENIVNFIEPLQYQAAHQKLIQIVNAMNQILNK